MSGCAFTGQLGVSIQNAKCQCDRGRRQGAQHASWFTRMPCRPAGGGGSRVQQRKESIFLQTSANDLNASESPQSQPSSPASASSSSASFIAQNMAYLDDAVEEDRRLRQHKDKLGAPFETADNEGQNVLNAILDAKGNLRPASVLYTVPWRGVLEASDALIHGLAERLKSQNSAQNVEVLYCCRNRTSAVQNYMRFAAELDLGRVALDTGDIVAPESSKKPDSDGNILITFTRPEVLLYKLRNEFVRKNGKAAESRPVLLVLDQLMGRKGLASFHWEEILSALSVIPQKEDWSVCAISLALSVRDLDVLPLWMSMMLDRPTRVIHETAPPTEQPASSSDAQCAWYAWNSSDERNVPVQVLGTEDSLAFSIKKTEDLEFSDLAQPEYAEVARVLVGELEKQHNRTGRETDRKGEEKEAGVLPALVLVHGRGEAELAGSALLSASQLTENQFNAQSSSHVTELTAYAERLMKEQGGCGCNDTDEIFLRIIEAGVAVCHSGISPALRQLSLSLFVQGIITVLVFDVSQGCVELNALPVVACSVFVWANQMTTSSQPLTPGLVDAQLVESKARERVIVLWNDAKVSESEMVRLTKLWQSGDGESKSETNLFSAGPLRTTSSLVAAAKRHGLSRALANEKYASYASFALRSELVPLELRRRELTVAFRNAAEEIRQSNLKGAVEYEALKNEAERRLSHCFELLGLDLGLQESKTTELLSYSPPGIVLCVLTDRARNRKAGSFLSVDDVTSKFDENEVEEIVRTYVQSLAKDQQTECYCFLRLVKSKDEQTLACCVSPQGKYVLVDIKHIVSVQSNDKRVQEADQLSKPAVEFFEYSENLNLWIYMGLEDQDEMGAISFVCEQLAEFQRARKELADSRDLMQGVSLGASVESSVSGVVREELEALIGVRREMKKSLFHGKPDQLEHIRVLRHKVGELQVALKHTHNELETVLRRLGVHLERLSSEPEYPDVELPGWDIVVHEDEGMPEDQDRESALEKYFPQLLWPESGPENLVDTFCELRLVRECDKSNPFLTGLGELITKVSVRRPFWVGLCLLSGGMRQLSSATLVGCLASIMSEVRPEVVDEREVESIGDDQGCISMCTEIRDDLFQYAKARLHRYPRSPVLLDLYGLIDTRYGKPALKWAQNMSWNEVVADLQETEPGDIADTLQQVRTLLRQLQEPELLPFLDDAWRAVICESERSISRFPVDESDLIAHSINVARQHRALESE